MGRKIEVVLFQAVGQNVQPGGGGAEPAGDRRDQGHQDAEAKSLEAVKAFPGVEDEGTKGHGGGQRGGATEYRSAAPADARR